MASSTDRDRKRIILLLISVLYVNNPDEICTGLPQPLYASALTPVMNPNIYAPQKVFMRCTIYPC